MAATRETQESGAQDELRSGAVSSFVVPADEVLTGGLDEAWERAVFLARGERATW
jgi:hypothetical protein